MPMSDVARAAEVDETRGFLKAVFDAESGQILGFAAIGLEGGEIMAAESFNTLFATIDG